MTAYYNSKRCARTMVRERAARRESQSRCMETKGVWVTPGAKAPAIIGLSLERLPGCLEAEGGWG